MHAFEEKAPFGHKRRVEPWISRTITKEKPYGSEDGMFFSGELVSEPRVQARGLPRGISYDDWSARMRSLR